MNTNTSHRSGETYQPEPQHAPQPQPQQQGFSASFVIILVSLLFVAIFGGALVGGIVSGGDPSDAFFMTIIGASAAAIAIAAIVSVRYYIHSKREEAAVTNGLPMKESYRIDIHGTFTRSEDDEDQPPARMPQPKQQRPPRPQQKQQQPQQQLRQEAAPQPPLYPARTPVESRIQEVHAARNFPGDVSAMSPQSYGMDTYAQTEFSQSEYQGHGYRIRIKPNPRVLEQRQREFDFSSVATSVKNGRPAVVREDPPEDDNGFSTGYNTNSEDDPYNHNTQRPLNRDPSAARVAADGEFQLEDVSDVGLNSPDNKSYVSKYEARDDVEEGTVAPDHSSVISHKKNMIAPPSKKAASEAGSAVSSLFLKPFAGMFGKKNKGASSEAGYSEASSFVKGSATGRKVKTSSSASDVGSRPPMPGRKTSGDKRETIARGNGDRYAPSTPGNTSTYSIPPPRRVPSTPESEARSGFQSMAEESNYSNGVASSTFDPAAHERAVKRHQTSAVPLGATLNDMPVYYEEDESAVESMTPSEARPGYDVFAPPGPIGIVVDTTEKGCIVHSLKKSSPMQGLINPGDLIMALDDFDVRKMDAASLTKLMAKKSQQKERKFTLISGQD